MEKAKKSQDKEDELKEDYSLILKKSENSSNVGRQICFALLAVTWALIYDQHSFRFHILLGLSALILLLYLFIDLMQYYYAAMRLKQMFYKIQLENDESKKNGLIIEYKTEKWKLSKFVNALFSLKFIMLGLSLLLLLSYIFGILIGKITIVQTGIDCCN
jgi:hypothetical protein